MCCKRGKVFKMMVRPDILYDLEKVAPGEIHEAELKLLRF